jgi:hypothetical protein
MAAVIPPLGAVFIVRSVVARELKLVAGEGGKEVRRQKAESRNDGKEKRFEHFCLLPSAF